MDDVTFSARRASAGASVKTAEPADADARFRTLVQSPLRAGRLMPGTHTPIVFPAKFKESPPDYVFVTAWNYADVIRGKESWFAGTWVTPLPDMRLF